MKTTIPFVQFYDHASMSTNAKLNLVGIFESLFAMEVPTRHPQMYILTRFEFPKGTHDVTLTLESYDPIELKVFEDGAEIGQAELPIYRLPKPFKK